MTDAANNICGLCCHCGKGNPYGKFYFMCLHCNLMICSGCHAKHPQSHRAGLRRCMDKMLPRNATPQGIKCSNCEQAAETRMECNACDIKLCFECWGEMQNKFLGHDHKAFTFIQPPDDYGLLKYDLECGSCLLGSSMTHCGRCFEGLMEGEKIFECLSCIEKLDECRTACEACISIAKAEHDPAHESISIVFREVKKDDEKYCSGKCDECLELLPINKETKMSHPHKTFAIEMGSIERQDRAHRNYRRCPRHPVRDIDWKKEEMHGSVGCACCWKRFPRESKIYYCMKCNFASCTLCHETGIANHPHPLFAAWLQDSTPSDEYWQNLLTADDKRWCDLCKESFLSGIQSHMRCRKCNDYDVCQNCINKEDMSIGHACGELPDVTYFDPDDMGEEWYEKQLTKAKEVKERLEEEERKEAEEARRAAAETARKNAEVAEAARREAAQRQTVARKPVSNLNVPTTASRVRAPSPSPAVGRTLAPPAPQAARRKSSSQLGMSFLKGALQVTTAVLKAENAMNRANGGGGGGNMTFVDFNNGGGGGGGGMDMSSFWAPINSAAGDPIQ